MVIVSYALWSVNEYVWYRPEFCDSLAGYFEAMLVPGLRICKFGVHLFTEDLLLVEYPTLKGM